MTDLQQLVQRKESRSIQGGQVRQDRAAEHRVAPPPL